MLLNPTEDDRLRIFTAAQLARATLDRGLAARGGASWQEVLDVGTAVAVATPVLDGVAELIPEIRLEVLFDEGTRLVVLREPFGAGEPGVRFGEGDVPLVPDRERRTLMVTNAGERPIRISSHFPFWDANPNLAFDREQARGFRLDLPAGDSLRWAPGETREVTLVALGGARNA